MLFAPVQGWPRSVRGPTNAVWIEPKGIPAVGGPAMDLPSAFTEDQDFRATTTPAVCGIAPAARGAPTMDLNSALQTYPNWRSVAKITIAEIAWSKVWPCASEIAASEIDPMKTMGSRTRNRKRIPRTNPINVLQTASVVTPPTPYKRLCFLTPPP